MTIGIYILKFIGTDKIYIGQSRHIEKRLQEHMHLLKNNLGAKKLQEAFRTYGHPTLEILLECSISELNQCESEAIDIFNSCQEGLNSVSYGIGGTTLYTTGENNPKCKYTNNQLEQVLTMLTGTEYYTHKEISTITNVGIPTIEGISSKTYHLWLKDSYPLLYSKLGKYRNIEFNTSKGSPVCIGKILVSPIGDTYTLSSIKGFCKVHNLRSGHLRDVLVGKTLQHKGWRLKE